MQGIESEVHNEVIRRFFEITSQNDSVTDGMTGLPRSLQKDWGSSPAFSVTPTAIEQIPKIVELAEHEKLAIIPVGGKNQLYCGQPPSTQRPYLFLQTSELNKVLDHQPDDLTITCEAGVTLQAVEEALAPYRQTLALDGPLPGSSTVGGLAATATAGLRRYAYGTPRDSIIGLKAVMSGGTTVKGGGKVVKNVAGYDVCKLFTGSWGSVGVLTEVTFKVRPCPETHSALIWHTDSLAMAVSAGFRLHLSGVRPTIATAFHTESRSALLCSFEGTSERVAWQLQEAERLIRSYGLTTTAQHASDGDLDRLRDLPATYAPVATIAGRIACLPADAEATTARLISFDPNSLIIDCTVGAIAVSFGPNSAVTGTQIKSILPGSANCVFTVLPNCGNANRSSDRFWDNSRADASLQRLLKANLDPLGTFSPDRFV